MRLVNPQNLNAQVVDLNGNIVRNLIIERAETNGDFVLNWDGQNDFKEIVQNGVYFFQADFIHQKKQRNSPQSLTGTELSVAVNYYDRVHGILNYLLEKPSLVLIHAGTYSVDPNSKKRNYSALKTIVNWEPRVGDSVIEAWDGRDDSGKYYVPNLENFYISISYRPLQQPFVITIGKRQ